jgi:hypothetical protein
MIEFIYDHIKYFKSFELLKSPNYKVVALNYLKDKNVGATFYNIVHNSYASKDLRLIHDDIVKEIYNNIKSNLLKKDLWND